ncbi:MAG TPA: hypothetical protein VNT55_21550 [Baekduia sp.]|nr:hypothetical protein [Baekduia sp.]
MSADDEQPDHTEDPRKQETGTGGYPETTPAGTEGDDGSPPPTDEDADPDDSDASG